MPELPEVETIRRQLEKEIVGRTVEEIWYDKPKMLRPSAREFVGGVGGKKVVGVSRRAKLLIFELEKGLRGVRGIKEDGGCFVCHLRLSGRLLVRWPNGPADDYVHVILKLKSQNSNLKSLDSKNRRLDRTSQMSKPNEGYDLELRFAEARLFGYMQYVPDEEALDKILEKFGPEPLGDLTAEKFFAILRKTKKPIKLVLMDQEKISGIGNIYANDALFLAKIHPQTPANGLTRQQSDGLLQTIEQVFQEGLKYGGASDQWYRQVHGEKGSYQEHFRVYGRVGQPCEVCGTTIKRITLGGRGTFYCPRCQSE
jgi:formamidopyrimidine-DNA glycosylase